MVPLTDFPLTIDYTKNGLEVTLTGQLANPSGDPVVGGEIHI